MCVCVCVRAQWFLCVRFLVATLCVGLQDVLNFVVLSEGWQQRRLAAAKVGSSEAIPHL